MRPKGVWRMLFFGGGEVPCATRALAWGWGLVVVKFHAPPGRVFGASAAWWLNSMRLPGVFLALLPPGG